MEIDKTIIRNFPNLTRWIKEELPKVQYNSRIFDPFVKYAQLTEASAKKALEINGSAPVIDAAYIRNAYGAFRPRYNRNRDKVFISRKLCREFNRLDPDQRFEKPWDKVMLATILHEMVHWGDFVFDTKKQKDSEIYDNVEEALVNGSDIGFQFEEAAFYGIYSDKFLS